MAGLPNATGRVMSGRYAIERLPNGFVSLRCRRSGLRGLFTPDGAARSGDLSYSMSPRAVRAILSRTETRKTSRLQIVVRRVRSAS